MANRSTVQRSGGSHNTGPVRRTNRFSAEDDAEPVRTPERNLVAAVLHRAFIDIHENNEDARRARRWIRAIGDKPFDYLWCCKVLELQPLTLREILLLKCTAVRIRRA